MPARRRTAGRVAASPEIPEGRSIELALARDSKFRRALAVADLAAAFTSLLVSVIVWGGHFDQPALLLAVPLIIGLNKAIGLYDRDGHLLNKTTLDEAPKIFNLATLCSVGVWMASPMFISGTFGRPQFLTLWAMLLTTTVLGRVAARRVTNRVAPVERCLVLGDDSSANRLSEKLESVPGMKARVVGRVGLGRDHSRESGALGTTAELGLILVEQDIERVIIAPSDSDTEDEILHGIRLVKSLGVKVSVLPRLFEVVGSSSEFDDVQGLTFLGVRPYGLTDSSWFLKRALDVSVSSVALFLLAPLMLGIAALIAITSPGGVFFRQKRIGFQARNFQITKFRTMYADAEARKAELRPQNEAAGLFKIADDPRITKVGGFLRKTSLDELPQLFNVLRGDMSLVGPRPLVPDEDSQIHGFDRRRLHVMPGMTGFWQIFGSSRVPLHEMVKIDYMYGANWSLWRDVKILLRTVPYVIARRGM